MILPKQSIVRPCSPQNVLIQAPVSLHAHRLQHVVTVSVGVSNKRQGPPSFTARGDSV